MTPSCARLKRRSRAFTIVELLVVITIISVLIAMLLPALQKARGVAQLQVCAGNLRQQGVAVVAYANDWKVLPLLVNAGNLATNVIQNGFFTTSGVRRFEGLGRLFPDKYLGGMTKAYPSSMTPKVWPLPAVSCAGRERHGQFAGSHALADYATGWHSSDDIWWGGIDGQRLRRNGKGAIFNPPGSSWAATATFSPTFFQYGVEWVRDYPWNTPQGGAKILIVDAYNTAESPSDIPHSSLARFGASNALLVDLRVTTIYSAFNPTLNQNIRPWMDGWGQEWWLWADARISGAMTATYTW